MEIHTDPYVNIANGIEIPMTFRKGDSVFKLMNRHSRLVLLNDEDTEIVVFEKKLQRLKGLCHEGKFVLAGKNENDKWEILSQEKINKPVEKWTLAFSKTRLIELSFQDPQVLLENLKRSRSKCRQDESCSMCLEALTDQTEDHIQTDCGHHFHRQCLKTWVYQNTCPNCRSPLINKKIKTK